MSRAAGEHERRGARAARVDLPRGTARSHEPLPGEHVPEKSVGAPRAEQGHARVRERRELWGRTARSGRRRNAPIRENGAAAGRGGGRRWGRESAYTSSHLMPACSVVIN